MSKFGWSYPPGAALDPSAPYNQTDDGPCDVCRKLVDECICPECPHCGEQGNPHCYTAGHDDTKVDVVVKMQLTYEQVVSRAEAAVLDAEERLQEANMYLEHLIEGRDFSTDLSDY